MSSIRQILDNLGSDHVEERRRAAGRGLAAGLLVGAALGTLAGLLFAPRPGRETRELLIDKAAEGVDQLKDALADFAGAEDVIEVESAADDGEAGTGCAENSAPDPVCGEDGGEASSQG